MDFTANVLLTLFSTFMGALIGGVVTWLVSSHYYDRATKDLSKATTVLSEKNEELASQVAVLQKITNVQTMGLGNQGLITARRDADGNMTILDATVKVPPATVTLRAPAAAFVVTPEAQPPGKTKDRSRSRKSRGPQSSSNGGTAK